jgi:putative nucleotidyltransferase with HDIG domain
MSDPLAALAQLARQEAWLVGGAVRDRLLSRATADYDVAVQEAPERLARSLGRTASGHPFQLSEGFGAWRVVAHDRSWQLDLLPLAGETIEHDLALRDLTVNAIAQPLPGGDYVDPFGGLADLRERRLRMVSAGAFAVDPLRALRLARLGGELEFAVDAASAGAARAAAPGLAQVAPERVFGELKRIISADAPLRGLALMDELGVSEVILPELSRLRGVEQSEYHHLDVHDHTSAVLAETLALERGPGRLFGEHAPAIAALLAEPLANELTRGQALRLGALFHDIAKPQTRDVTAAGRVTFIGHDESGADLARAVLARLRASERLCEHVAALARHHLRLGFLVHEMPLSRQATYRYLRACEPVQVDVTLLSVADRLATRGQGADVAIERHVELARQLMGDALAWRARRPRPPVRGNELVRALGVVPGPALGRLLAELEQAAFAGEITTREQAIARARELLGSPAGRER